MRRTDGMAKKLVIPHDTNGYINAGIAFITNTFAPHVGNKKFSIASIIRGGQLGLWNRTKFPPEVSEAVAMYGDELRTGRRSAETESPVEGSVRGRRAGTGRRSRWQ